jgi:hypothetical protein
MMMMTMAKGAAWAMHACNGVNFFWFFSFVSDIPRLLHWGGLYWVIMGSLLDGIGFKASMRGLF